MKPTYKEFIELELKNTYKALDEIDAKLIFDKIVHETKREVLTQRLDKLKAQLGVE